MEMGVTSVSNVVWGEGSTNSLVSLQGLFLDYNIFPRGN